MKTPPKDVGASVRARLLSLAREQRDDFQLVLLRYANERRCARSLKGAKGFAYRHGEMGIRQAPLEAATAGTPTPFTWRPSGPWA